MEFLWRMDWNQTLENQFLDAILKPKPILEPLYDATWTNFKH